MAYDAIANPNPYTSVPSPTYAAPLVNFAGAFQQGRQAFAPQQAGPGGQASSFAGPGQPLSLNPPAGLGGQVGAFPQPGQTSQPPPNFLQQLLARFGGMGQGGFGMGGGMGMYQPAGPTRMPMRNDVYGNPIGNFPTPQFGGLY